MVKEKSEAYWTKYTWAVWLDEELGTLQKRTRVNYERDFKRFVDYLETTTGRLYIERKADIVSVEPIERTRSERRVYKFMTHMRELGYAHGTVRNMLSAVRSFYASTNMKLDIDKNKIPKGKSMGTKAISISQICDMRAEMSFSRWRLRNFAILYALNECGLRISDLRRLDYGDWINAETIYNDRGEPFKVLDPEITKKKWIYALIHFGPESVKAIEDYLEYRINLGEVLENDSPLFTVNKGTERIGEDAMGSLIWHSANNLGMKRISAHSLRRFHRTRLQKAKMNDQWINKLQGKASDPYARPEDQGNVDTGYGDLTEEYIKSYDVLRVLNIPDKAEIPEMPEIHAKVANLENIVKSLLSQMNPDDLTGITDDIKDDIENISDAPPFSPDS